MQLDDRKSKILQAIIKTYLETGEPVGSRTISKYADLNLSSATIRNEMADLEELGYIIQPHTSAGRIPTDTGYRLYVDQLMEEKEREVTEMKELMIQKQDKMDLVLKEAAKVLAANTNYATMVSTPQYRRTKLKFIQLSQVDEGQLLAVVVSENNVVKNKMIRIEHLLDNETILKLNILLNTSLNGRLISYIDLNAVFIGILNSLGHQISQLMLFFKCTDQLTCSPTVTQFRILEDVCGTACIYLQVFIICLYGFCHSIQNTVEHYTVDPGLLLQPLDGRQIDTIFKKE